MAKDILFMFIEGDGTPAHGLRVHTTGPLSSALKTDLGGIVELRVMDFDITVPAVQFGPLDAFSSDTGVTVNVQYTASSSALLGLTGSAWLEHGSEARLRRYIEDDDVSVAASNTGNIADDDYVWLGDEVLQLGAFGAITARGLLGTVAQRHPVTFPGAVLFDGIPERIRRRARVYRARTDTETLEACQLLFYGRVRSISTKPNGRTEVALRSEWTALKGRTWRPPRADVQGSATSCVAQRQGDVLQVWGPVIDANLYGGSSLSGPVYWRFVTIVSEDGEFAIFDKRLNFAAGSSHRFRISERPVAMGREGVFYPEARWPELFADTGTVDVRVEYTPWFADGDAKLSAVIEGLITGTLPTSGLRLPWTMTADLPSELVHLDSLAQLDVAVGLDRVTNYSDGVSDIWLWPPANDDEKLSDVLARVIGAVGCGLTVAASGKLRIIDWMEDPTPTVTLTPNDLANLDWSYVRSTVSVLRRVELHASRVDGGTELQGFTSAVASALYPGIGGVERAIGFLPAAVREWLYWRWGNLFRAYELAKPMLTLVVHPHVNIDVGDTVGLTFKALPGDDGSDGVVNLRARVLQRGERARDGVQALQLLLTGFGRGALAGGDRGPTAAVDGDQAGGPTTITIAANAFTDAAGGVTDAEVFGAVAGAVGTGAKVYLLSRNWTRLDDNAPTVTGTGGNRVMISTAFSSGGGAIDPVPDGARIVLADYDEQPVAVKASRFAFYAGVNGTLGSGGDAPRNYG